MSLPSIPSPNQSITATYQSQTVYGQSSILPPISNFSTSERPVTTDPNYDRRQLSKLFEGSMRFSHNQSGSSVSAPSTSASGQGQTERRGVAYSLNSTNRRPPPDKKRAEKACADCRFHKYRCEVLDNEGGSCERCFKQGRPCRWKHYTEAEIAVLKEARAERARLASEAAAQRRPSRRYRRVNAPRKANHEACDDCRSRKIKMYTLTPLPGSHYGHERLVSVPELYP
jgi:hypothetical protein